MSKKGGTVLCIICNNVTGFITVIEMLLIGYIYP